MRLTLAVAAFALTACGENPPTWALDSIFLDPDGSIAQGTHVWQVYKQRWERRFHERHYVCGVLLTLDGVASAPDCPDCQAAWDLDAIPADTDCAGQDAALAERPLWTGLLRLGVGAPDADGPQPGAVQAWADFGDGWEAYGHGWPDALQHGLTPGAPTWDGAEPFAFVPDAVWSLADPVAHDATAGQRTATPAPRWDPAPQALGDRASAIRSAATGRP